MQLAATLVILDSSFLFAASTIRGRAIGVSDGDTITVLDANELQHKIRLTGIDAPEKAQPFGNVSKKHLSGLVYRKQVRVETTKKDRYGRELGKVWVQPADCPTCGLTLDANLAQVTAGLGWWYREYANEQPVEDRQRYEFAEKEARAKRVGLWRDVNPVPPWEWRHRPADFEGTSIPQGAGCVIKGNINAKGLRIYHLPGQLHYSDTQISETKGERWFCNEADAETAGWRRSRN